jgi:hypothetical protein
MIRINFTLGKPYGSFKSVCVKVRKLFHGIYQGCRQGKTCFPYLIVISEQRASYSPTERLGITMSAITKAYHYWTASLRNTGTEFLTGISANAPMPLQEGSLEGHTERYWHRVIDFEAY